MLDANEESEVDVSEKSKLLDNYLKREIDRTIASCLNYDKEDLQEAYNLRNGERDMKDFEYLWSAYGIEFPSQLRHVPVLRSMFDALSGQQEKRPLKPMITITDEGSIDQMLEEKKKKLFKEVDDTLFDHVEKNAEKVENGEMSPKQAGDELGEKIKEIQKKYKSRRYQSTLEIQAQHVLNWLILKKNIKMVTNVMFNDIVTAGSCFYQSKIRQLGISPDFRALNPIGLYFVKPENTIFIKDCDRVVYKERLSVTDVWTQYGDRMKPEDRKAFKSQYNKYIGSEIEIMSYDLGILESSPSGKGDHQMGINTPLIDVSYVEFKANTKIPAQPRSSMVDGKSAESAASGRKFKYRLDLYEGVRIGSDIYVDMGRSKYARRDPDEPWKVDLSINGICYNDRNGKPYSTVIKTKEISNKIDILHYHAENLLALSGTKAVMVNFADIPTWMGKNPTQRMMKWLGYVKQGIAVVDYNNQGEGAGKFNNMGDVDLSLSASVQGIFTMIEYMEETARKVTGVSRQALGAITQNDGKATAQMAIENSAVVTQPLYTTLDNIVNAALSDILNDTRVAYPDGVKGSYLNDELGQVIFKSGGKDSPLSNYNVFVNSDGEEQAKLAEIKTVAQELIRNQLLDAEIAVDIVTIQSITEIKERIKDSVESSKQSKEQEMSQQIEDYEKQLKEANAQIEKVDQMTLEQKQQELALAKERLSQETSMKEKEVAFKKDIDDKKIELESRRVDLEALQLSFGDGNSQEIRNK